jgi:hypothetical protein
MKKVMYNVKVEDAELMFRNFSGKGGNFNPEGRRVFNVVLPMQTAIDLEKDGWNVRWLDPIDENEEKKPILQVVVNYGYKPPKIIMVSSRGKSSIDESSVKILDWAEIVKADVVITPYNWFVKGKHGVSGYLKSLAVVIEEDELELKYRDVPDSAVNTIGGCGNCEVCDGTCKSDETQS